ncbi:serglycin [Acanthopagrus latus]|uniref:serglycin n=1 Tax=Acanthopagrus latus TaxID=8177 RepID=UPI00187CCF95|nr:serglycin [Acanthopagrus latus]
MRVILFLVICCLALHNGKGTPKTAVYKFVRCNPEGNQANCVTLQSPQMEWSPELPAKLPASTAQYLEAEPVEEELPEGEEGEEEEPMMGQEGELPEYDYGSGQYEGSGAEGWPMADMGITAAESETGSGETWTEENVKLNKDGNMMRRLFPSRSLVGVAKPAEHELREDNLLQL